MKVQTAQNLYHGAEGYNCAQAILKTFQDDFDIADHKIMEAKKYGGGRADEGVCGALFAGSLLLENADLIQKINQGFTAISGSPYCREIKKLKSISCKECVKVAAQQIDQLIKK